jgi:RNA-directed DNA polymerase
VITGISREVLMNEVKPLVEQFLQERGLRLSQEKTVLTHIADGFDFLGQHICKYNGKLIIKPSRKSVQALLRKVRGIVKANPQLPPAELIVQLNPILQGWANYHAHVVSKVTFANVDHAIFQLLWRWARRRHPNKSKSWVKRKYFTVVNGRDWVFYGETERDGTRQRHRIKRLAYVPIKRHVKIQGAANPYDPAWEVYFEKRLGVKMSDDLKGRRQLLYLWKEQGGLCPICHQAITEVTGWHNHHIVWRVHGGSDGIENRVLLHPNCHSQVHSQQVTVVKLRPATGVREA